MNYLCMKDIINIIIICYSRKPKLVIDKARVS
jgi:hypothetical protein